MSEFDPTSPAAAMYCKEYAYIACLKSLKAFLQVSIKEAKANGWVDLERIYTRNLSFLNFVEQSFKYDEQGVDKEHNPLYDVHTDD